MIIGRNLINEYYEDEKLYSTGDDYLDEMLEKAFCEGYEYAQKEFATRKVLGELVKDGAKMRVVRAHEIGDMLTTRTKDQANRLLSNPNLSEKRKKTIEKAISNRSKTIDALNNIRPVDNVDPKKAKYASGDFKTILEQAMPTKKWSSEGVNMSKWSRR